MVSTTLPDFFNGRHSVKCNLQSKDLTKQHYLQALLSASQAPSSLNLPIYCICLSTWYIIALDRLEIIMQFLNHFFTWNPSNTEYFCGFKVIKIWLLAVLLPLTVYVLFSRFLYSAFWMRFKSFCWMIMTDHSSPRWHSVVFLCGKPSSLLS